MFRGRTSKHAFLPVFLVVVVGVFLFSSHGAYAIDIVGVAGGVITTIINGILAGILWILGWILALGGLLANYMLQPGPITTSPIVQTGWGIVRDFANMFFILILLGIALDFILFESFGVKKALPQLLIVALLINFSLPIAGILIDFANTFANFFISKVTGNCTATGCGFTETLAQVLGLTNVFDANFLKQTADEAAAGAGLMADQAFAIFFMLGTIVIMYALALMFLIRVGWLYLLLVILPGVLVLSAFPPTRGHLSNWMHKFIQWTMFAPVATFFLYLSMMIFQGNTAADAAATLTQGADASVSGIIQQGFTYIMVWFFMLASLMAAQGMGVKMAGATMKVFSNAGRWTRGKLSQAGKRAWRETGGKAAESAAGAIGARGGILGGFAARQLQRVGVASRGVEATRDAELQAKYKNYTPQELEQEIQRLNTNPLNRATVAKLVAMQAKQGEAARVVGRNPNETYGVAPRLVNETDEAYTARLDDAYNIRNQGALLETYNNHFTSEADRRLIRRGNPELALHVLDPNNAPNAQQLTPQRRAQMTRERDEYIGSLRSTDIEKMGRASINQHLIGEMVRTDSWTESKFKAMYDNAGAGFVNAFNAFTGNPAGLGDTFPAQQNLDSNGNPVGQWYPAGQGLSGNAQIDDQNAELALQGTLHMSLPTWRRLVHYTRSTPATNIGITQRTQ